MAALLRSRDAGGTLGLYGDTSAFVHVDNGRITAWPELSAAMRTGVLHRFPEWRIVHSHSSYRSPSNCVVPHEDY